MGLAAPFRWALLAGLLLLTACEKPKPYVMRPPDRFLATGTALLTTGKALPAWCTTPRAVGCAPHGSGFALAVAVMTPLWLLLALVLWVGL